MALHNDELELPQMVIDGRIKGRPQNPQERGVVHRLLSEIPARPPPLKRFMQIHGFLFGLIYHACPTTIENRRLHSWRPFGTTLEPSPLIGGRPNHTNSGRPKVFELLRYPLPHKATKLETSLHQFFFSTHLLRMRALKLFSSVTSLSPFRYLAWRRRGDSRWRSLPGGRGARLLRVWRRGGPGRLRCCSGRRRGVSRWPPGVPPGFHRRRRCACRGGYVP